MLERIYIQNLLFIEKVDIDLKSGFSVITGETGAGKSILFECIKFALGSKLPPNFVSDNGITSTIILEFDISNNLVIQQKLETDMIEFESNKLTLKKIFVDEKKSKIFLNDTPVSNVFIKQIANDLIEYQGQHSQALLLNAQKHLEILDHYADLTPLLSEITKLHLEISNMNSNLNELEQRILTQEKEKDYLSHIVKELEEINPKEGEVETLANQRTSLLKQQKNINNLQDAIAYLDKVKVFENLNNAYKVLLRCDNNIINLDQEVNNLDQITIELEDVKTRLENKLLDISSNDNQSSIEDRLFLLREIARKYRVQPDELSNLLKKTLANLEQLNHLDMMFENLKKEISIKRNEYLKIARNISEKRRNAAKQLEISVEKELQDLKMEKTIFRVRILTDENKISANGIDQIEFMATNNPGLPLAPLKDISSGGEISRFMLAIRVVITKLKSPPVIIFDEIDTGLGGAVADAVGKKIKLLSSNYQILAVTHHPQVAAKADQHYLVQKTFSNEKTNMNISLINNTAQIEELARMISGSVITNESRVAATQLLNNTIFQI